MAYIDGFVMAVPNANKKKFIEHCNQFDPLWLEFGATRVLENWGDDVPTGKQTDFHRAVHAKDDESIVFSWVEWPDKATRDIGMEKMMKDPRMDPKKNPMPFDGMRMIYGGFSPVLDIGSSSYLEDDLSGRLATKSDGKQQDGKGESSRH